MARHYLTKACHPDQVYVTTGQLTAMLRARWGINSIFGSHNRLPAEGEEPSGGKGKKSRDDHRHHAVDACVIGAIDRSLLQEMSRRAGQAEIEDRERITADVPQPFEGFRDAVRASIEKVVVSVKPEHGTGGALHEDTAYGLVHNKGEATEIGNLVFRKPLTDLTTGEIDRIRDPHLREEVRAATNDARHDKKRLAAALARFSAERAPGRERGIRRVRIGKAKTGEVHVRDRRNGAVYKALIPGENHHIDIVQMRDGSWKGYAATVFEVNQKGWRPEWEIEKIGGKLVMRLHKGDTIEVNDKHDSSIRHLMTVHRLSPSNNVLYLAPHNEGGALAARDQDGNDPVAIDNSGTNFKQYLVVADTPAAGGTPDTGTAGIDAIYHLVATAWAGANDGDGALPDDSVANGGDGLNDPDVTEVVYADAVGTAPSGDVAENADDA